MKILAQDSELKKYLNYSKLKRACEIVKSFKKQVLVVSHHDSDGLCAAAIVLKSLLRLGKMFHLKILKNPDKEMVKKLPTQGLIIFTDIGLSFLKPLSQMENTVSIILDHHRVEEIETEGENIIEISARSFSLDGTNGCCGSTLAFLFALALDERNSDLFPLALTGMIGDRQYINIQGLNHIILKSMTDGHSFVEKLDNRLNLCGETIENALLTNTDPFFKGISGRKEAIREYLKKIKVDGKRKLKELNEKENAYLINLLSIHLLKAGATSSTLKELCVTKFYVEIETEKGKMTLDLRDFSEVVDSCARKEEQELGVALALGDFSEWERAVKHRECIRKKVMEGMITLESARIRKRKAIQYFINPNPSISSPLCGLGMSYLLEKDKPTLVLSIKDDTVHVSARATKELVSQGLDLSKVMRMAARSAGGDGGGHDIASGASFPKSGMKKFLEEADRVTCEMLGR